MRSTNWYIVDTAVLYSTDLVKSFISKRLAGSTHMLICVQADKTMKYAMCTRHPCRTCISTLRWRPWWMLRIIAISRNWISSSKDFKPISCSSWGCFCRFFVMASISVYGFCRFIFTDHCPETLLTYIPILPRKHNRIHAWSETKRQLSQHPCVQTFSKTLYFTFSISAHSVLFEYQKRRVKTPFIGQFWSILEQYEIFSCDSWKLRNTQEYV